jgi:hypothetical protein
MIPVVLGITIAKYYKANDQANDKAPITGQAIS